MENTQSFTVQSGHEIHTYSFSGVLSVLGSRVFKKSLGIRKNQALAEQGHAQAQNSLGYMYDAGNGVSQDLEEAAKWYRKAAEQVEASAQFNLGVMYDRGEGVPMNSKEAVKWFRNAAEQGLAQAQRHLG